MTNDELQLFLACQQTTLVEAMQKIDGNANGIIFIVDENKCLRGAVSDGDIRRWLLNAGSIDSEIVYIMNKHPYSVHKGSGIDVDLFMKEKSISALPETDEYGVILDIHLSKEKNNNKKVLRELTGVPVVIMAGGKGTRLYPYTKILPKPLIPIGEIPIVERVINSFNNYGVIDFFMTVNYKKNMIKSYFADIDKSYIIDYVEEEKPLGTGGSLKLIKRDFRNPIIITNCDILIKMDYNKLYKYHEKSGNAVTIVTAMKNDTIPYGVIYSKENGEIDHMVEKPTMSYLINTGMYIIAPDLIGLIPDDTMFHMTDLVDKAKKAGYRIGMYPVSEDSFLDMGEFAEMKRMEEKLGTI